MKNSHNKFSSKITMNWREHNTYELAYRETNAAYLFELDGIPFHWGILNKNTFGDRYSPSNRPLFEGLLQSGGKLYLSSIANLPPGSEMVDIERHLINKYGQTMYSRTRKETNKLDISHYGNVPICISENAINTNIIESINSEPRTMTGVTFKRKIPFNFSISEAGLCIIYPNKYVLFSLKNMLEILDKVDTDFNGNSFLLENCAIPAVVIEPGFGTLFCDLLNRPRGDAPITSRLSAVFSAAGIFESFTIKGEPNKPTRLRLLIRPESEIDLMNLIENIPNDID